MNNKLHEQSLDIKNKLFDFKQRVSKVENYKEQIDANKNSIQDIVNHVKQQMCDMKESQEKEKMKSLQESQRMQKQIQKMATIMEDLPIKMAQCET